VRLNPSVIVSATIPANLAARGATDTTPIVTAAGGDPVAFGLVKSLSHPGGNVTGLATFAELLASKQIDLLRELMPHLAMLVDVSDPVHLPQLRETMAAATANGITWCRVKLLQLTNWPPHLKHYLKSALKPYRCRLIHYSSTSRIRVAELAAKKGLPAIYGLRENVEDGGLMSYGPDHRDGFRRAAVFVDKILKGVKPADLPVEQPIKLELLINLKTARALGLTIPPTLLARADEVIE
jgi:putative tryptophan/tyrosine transport system substrate-binding protein